MTRVIRRPETLGTLDLYARLGGGPGALSDPDRIATFLDRIRAGVLESTANAARIHGWHRQNMFEALVVAFGNFRLLKMEDAGECFYQADSEIAIPDYRFISAEGERVLIEIKNHYRETALDPLRLDRNYVQKLSRYATIENSRLLIGVYWGSVNHWTLTDVARLDQTGADLTLDYVRAYTYNEAGMFGDRLIGTEPPIEMRIPADRSKPRTIDADGHVRFITGIPTFRVGARELTRDSDKDLAMRILLWSPWPDSQTIESDGDRLDAIVISATPEQPAPRQNFQFLGWLSQYFAAHYWLLTAEGGDDIRRLMLDHDPASMASILLPFDKAIDFPLWQFRVVPREGEGAAGPAGADA